MICIVPAHHHILTTRADIVLIVDAYHSGCKEGKSKNALEIEVFEDVDDP